MSMDTDTIDDLSRALTQRPTYAKAGYYSEAVGWVEDPQRFFDNERAKIYQALGSLHDVKLPLNRILVAIWVRPTERHSKPGTAGLIIPDTVRDEDKWQGVAGLVVKLGPHAYSVNEEIPFVDGDKCAVGDWVLFRRGDGFRTRLNGWECVVLESERGVKMVLPRPDLVY